MQRISCSVQHHLLFLSLLRHQIRFHKSACCQLGTNFSRYFFQHTQLSLPQTNLTNTAFFPSTLPTPKCVPSLAKRGLILVATFLPSPSSTRSWVDFDFDRPPSSLRSNKLRNEFFTKLFLSLLQLVISYAG